MSKLQMLAHETLCGVWLVSGVARIETNYNSAVQTEKPVKVTMP